MSFLMRRIQNYEILKPKFIHPKISYGIFTMFSVHCMISYDPGLDSGKPGLQNVDLAWQSWWRWWNSSRAISNPGRWCCESAALNMPANLENSAVATGLEKVNFHSNPKERQCQRMLKLPHNCSRLTHEKSNAQNSPSQASAIHEPWISRCSSWF